MASIPSRRKSLLRGTNAHRWTKPIGWASISIQKTHDFDSSRRFVPPRITLRASLWGLKFIRHGGQTPDPRIQGFFISRVVRSRMVSKTKRNRSLRRKRSTRRHVGGTFGYGANVLKPANSDTPYTVKKTGFRTRVALDAYIGRMLLFNSYKRRPDLTQGEGNSRTYEDTKTGDIIRYVMGGSGDSNVVLIIPKAEHEKDSGLLDRATAHARTYAERTILGSAMNQVFGKPRHFMTYGYEQH